MSLSPLVFTGISRFSADFQTILNRALSIASIPVKQLQNQQLDLLSRKQLLTELRTSVGTLASTLSALGTLGANKSIKATTSHANRVSVQTNGANQTGTHTITEITSVAKAAAETSNSGFATAGTTAVSGTGNLELVVGSATYSRVGMTAEENNLNAIRDWINSLGAGVTASVLNTGSGASPYYLYISADATGAKMLQLRTTSGDTGSNILTATNQGADAAFRLDGIAITRPDNVVSDAIAGVTFTLLSQTDAGETVTLTLASDRYQLASKLETFATQYNDVANRINAQIGKSAGLLSGDSSIRQTQDALREITGYQHSGGSILRLADLGIEFDDTGKASFNSSKFYALSDADFSASFSFIGSTTTAFGGLTSRLTAISDPVSGLIKIQQDLIDSADTRISKQIEDLNARIDYSQKALSARLQSADSLLAKLESQQTVLDASLRSLELVMFGKKDQ
jgi:flagellar hook-associated protein 2